MDELSKAGLIRTTVSQDLTKKIIGLQELLNMNLRKHIEIVKK